MNKKNETLSKQQNGNDFIADVSESSWLYYEQELNKITQLNQTQTSLSKQMEILRPFANKLGLYDVADYLGNSR